MTASPLTADAALTALAVVDDHLLQAHGPEGLAAHLRAAADAADRHPTGCGLLALASVVASRGGTDVGPAVIALAEGQPLRGALSDYELRAAVEEGEEALGDGLARARHRVARGQGDRASDDLSSRPVVDPIDAAIAAHAGADRWSWAGPDDADLPLVARLARLVGAELTTVSDDASGVDDTVPVVGPPRALIGWDAIDGA